ncbi:Translation initiation factor SUI1-related protein [Richelia intracellularis HH01]|jgi:translation initiation factor 1|uniref:Translation initiation factor SUI1-related protein n=1 Tax=Richelia intracellularis HH01 TaxID=1165094 RepID=M1X0Y9_9NOST|nr:translation initiation factor [Richelia intracellularis]CCH67783.1 Translation initiation factor SUI1-related protein [Richelia intracellularis HH01]
MASSNSKSYENITVYSEFGSHKQTRQEKANPDLSPEKQHLQIQGTRTGRKGKTVTIVTGFQTNPDNLQALLKQLKTQCGTGGTVKDNTIEIQGEQKQKILTILEKKGYKVKITSS